MAAGAADRPHKPAASLTVCPRRSTSYGACGLRWRSVAPAAYVPGPFRAADAGAPDVVGHLAVVMAGEGVKQGEGVRRENEPEG